MRSTLKSQRIRPGRGTLLHTEDATQPRSGFFVWGKKMAKLEIFIEDIDDEVEVKCVGDTTIIQKATPAQVLANKCMEFIAKELNKEC